MIFVFADDHTLAVIQDMPSVRTECEAVDVADGVYRFFDEQGQRLIPRFTAPVERATSVLGVKMIDGGHFELDLDPLDEGSEFDRVLSEVVAGTKPLV